MDPKFVLNVYPLGSPESYDSDDESELKPPELPAGLVLPKHPKRSTPSTSKIVVKKSRKSTAQSSDIAMEKNVVAKKRSIEEVHYEYWKLFDIFNCYPLSEKKYVSVYGIISSYDKYKETMVILDETVDNFSWFPNIRSSSLTFKTGDIIRVHRLLLEVNKTRRSINERNIVIFESFCDEIFKPQSLAANPTFEDCDNYRVEELTKLNTKYLIEEPIIKKINDFWTIQSAFLVLGVQDDETNDRTIVCCWSPHDLFANYPCKPQMMSLEQLLRNVQAESPALPLSNDIIRKLFIKRRLIFIKVYGQHRLQAQSLKAFDIAVVFNLLRDKDSFYEGKYSYKLYDQDRHGQCIRQASNESHLAEEFRKRILDYLGDEEKLKQLDSAPNYIDENLEKTYNSLNENIETNSKESIFKKRASIFKENYENFFHSDDSDIEIKEIETTHDSCSIIMTSSDDGSTEGDRNYNILTVDADEFLEELSFEEIGIIEKQFPNFGNINHAPVYDIWPRYESIDAVKHLPAETTFVLEAALSTFYGRTVNNETIFDDIKILRPMAMILECSRSECCHKMAFETEQTEIRSGFLRCPKCSYWTCDVFLDLHLILQDKNDDILNGRWTGKFANDFFKCNIYDLADSKFGVKFASKLKTIMKFLWSYSRSGINIYWKLQVKDNDQQKEFQIIDAKLIAN